LWNTPFRLESETTLARAAHQDGCPGMKAAADPGDVAMVENDGVAQQPTRSTPENRLRSAEGDEGVNFKSFLVGVFIGVSVVLAIVIFYVLLH
jgi:hypothetical protein